MLLLPRADVVESFFSNVGAPLSSSLPATSGPNELLLLHNKTAVSAWWGGIGRGQG